MFTSSWIEFAILMVIFAALTGQRSLLALATLLVIILPIAWLWARAAFLRLEYERRLGETHVFEGERAALTVRLLNRKWLPLAWVRVDDHLPMALETEEKRLSPSNTPMTGVLEQRASLLGRERASWKYTLVCERRGFYLLGPAVVHTGDVFGLFERKRTYPHLDRLVVYPRIDPIEDWGLPSKEPFGDARTRLPLFHDPTRIRGLREYHPEDPPKHIHWRTTARHNALMVKQYDPTVNYNWVFFLDVQTYPHAWQGVDSERAERAIRLTASLANFAASRKYAFGLVANGTYPESDQRLRVLPGRDPGQLRRVLEALAAVSYFIASPIDTLLRRESPGLPWGAALIVVTTLVTENLIAEMQRLCAVGRNLALVSLDDNWKLAPLAGIVVHRAHPPEYVDSAADRKSEKVDRHTSDIPNAFGDPSRSESQVGGRKVSVWSE